MQVTPERYRRIAIASLVALFVGDRRRRRRATHQQRARMRRLAELQRDELRRRVVEARRDRAGQPAVQRARHGRRARSSASCRIESRPRPRGVVGLAWTLVVLRRCQRRARRDLGARRPAPDRDPGPPAAGAGRAGRQPRAVAGAGPTAIARTCSRRRPHADSSGPWSLARSAAIVAGTLVTGVGPARRRRDGASGSTSTSRRSPACTASIVIATIAVAVVARGARQRSARRAARRSPTPCRIWMFVGIVQAAIGYIQYFNDLPELLVGAHVAGAAARHAGDDASRAARRARLRRRARLLTHCLS